MNESILTKMETFFLALADKTRLRLLNLMREDEVCVSYFTEVLGESQPKISRHLAYLRKAGIVEARREGQWMHYKLSPAKGRFHAKLLECLSCCLNDVPEFARDVARVRRSSCGTGECC